MPGAEIASIIGMVEPVRPEDASTALAGSRPLGPKPLPDGVPCGWLIRVPLRQWWLVRVVTRRPDFFRLGGRASGGRPVRVVPAGVHVVAYPQHGGEDGLAPRVEGGAGRRAATG